MIHQQTWMVIWLHQSGWYNFWLYPDYSHYVTLIIPWYNHSMWLMKNPDGSQVKNFEHVVALGPALLCCPSGPIRMKGLECCRMLRQGLRLKVWFLHFHCTQFWFPIAILVHSRVADRTLKWTWTAMGRFEPFWTWESSIFFRLFTWFEYVWICCLYGPWSLQKNKDRPKKPWGLEAWHEPSPQVLSSDEQGILPPSHRNSFCIFLGAHR